MRNTGNHDAFSEAILFRCPKPMRDAIAAATREQFTTAANYVRGAVTAQLKADGLIPRPSNDFRHAMAVDDGQEITVARVA
jgi:hypothetical protein